MKITLVARRKSYPEPQNAKNDEIANIDFHGASILNEHSEEIPITESMVQHACKFFIQQWEIAQKRTLND